MKAMVTTNTSSSLYAIILSQKNGHEGGMRFDLYPAEGIPESITIASGGCLLDTAPYDICVSLPSNMKPLHADININGEDTITFSLDEGKPDPLRSSATIYALFNGRSETGSRADNRLFSLTYGFARIEVELVVEMERSIILSTKDIPCQARNLDDAANVEDMLIQLLDSDNEASKWMFSHYATSQKAPYSILEGSIQNRSPRSLSTTLHLIKRVLAEYSLQREYFRNHGYTRIVKTQKIVPLSRVRRAGYEELDWLSKNLSMLSEVPESRGISMYGKSYLPQRVRTEVRVKTHDSYENRLILGFLSEVVKTARTLRNSLRGSCDEIKRVETTLEGFRSEGAVIPSLALVRSLTIRESSCLDQLDALISLGNNLLRDYLSFLPGVASYFTRAPHRTKVFQEVRAYSQVFTLILEWINFGDFSVAKEGLALHLLRTDKLYEYYSLYRILCWLSYQGYTPSNEESHPIRCGNYLPRRRFRPETQIASIFNLHKGKNRLKLYYQPIIHAGLDEEEGIPLHRLSSRRSFWTPDYLIEITSESNQKSFHVIDAKYRPAQDLYDSFSRPSELSTCIMKYMHDVAGENGKRVSSVWLAAGKQKGKDLYYAETSVWYEQNRSDFGARSGIFILNPKVSRLDEVFEEITQQSVASPQKDIASARSVTPKQSDSRREQSASAQKGLENKHDKVDDRGQTGTSGIEVQADGEFHAPVIHGSSLSAAAENATSADEARELDDNNEMGIKASRDQRKRLKQAHTPRLSTGIDAKVKDGIETIIRRFTRSDYLYDGNWAQKNLGLNRPLLRKNPPIGREATFYSSLKVDETTYWVCSKWMPNQKARLTRFADKLSGKASE